MRIRHFARALDFTAYLIVWGLKSLWYWFDELRRKHAR